MNDDEFRDMLTPAVIVAEGSSISPEVGAAIGEAVERSTRALIAAYKDGFYDGLAAASSARVVQHDCP